MGSTVDPTTHNANPDLKLECGPLPGEIPDERSDPALADGRSELQKQRLQDPAFRESSLYGLAKAREARSWSDVAILDAIRDFYRRHAQVPKQADFRSANGLPGCGTVWRRFGSDRKAVALALGDISAKKVPRVASGPKTFANGSNLLGPRP